MTGSITLLADHPALMARVSIAERIGGRRWMLRLADGGSVQLPGAGNGGDWRARCALPAPAGPRRARSTSGSRTRTLVREPESRNETRGGKRGGDWRHLKP